MSGCLTQQKNPFLIAKDFASCFRNAGEEETLGYILSLLDNLTASTDGEAVTPHDVYTIEPTYKGFIVNADGPVKVTTLDRTTLTFSALAGVHYKLVVTQIFDTGTTATEVFVYR